jgi:hypothetical protein
VWALDGVAPSCAAVPRSTVECEYDLGADGAQGTGEEQCSPKRLDDLVCGSDRALCHEPRREKSTRKGEEAGNSGQERSERDEVGGSVVCG